MPDKPPRLGLFHQAGDYLVAAVLLLSLSRAERPVWPLLLGVIALANASMTRGPLAAYRLVPLSAHHAIDATFVVACLVGAIALRNTRLDSAVLVTAGILQAGVVWSARRLRSAKENHPR